MRLDHQGPPVTYSEVASRPPQREATTLDALEMCDVWVKVCSSQARKGSHLSPPSTRSGNRNGTNKLPEERKRSMSFEEFANVRPDVSWRRRGLSGRRSIIMSEGPLELVPIPSPTPWDGVNMSGPERTSTKVPNGLGIYGVPAPCTTSNWSRGWSACGALLRLTNGPSKMFIFARLHPTS